MSIKLLQIDTGLVTPKDDAILYDWLLRRSTGVMEGCTVTSLGANQLQVAAGRLVVMGRQVVIEQETILATLSASGTVNGRVLIHIDLNDSATPIKFLTQAAETLPDLTQEDINHGGTVYEYPLATYQVDQTQISGLISAITDLGRPVGPDDLPTHLPNPSALSISKGYGGQTGTYDGSAARSISIPQITISASSPGTLSAGDLWGVY